jgi:hypothetical protein
MLKRLLVILLILAVATLIFILGYRLGQQGIPHDCAELGATYLQIGRRTLGITSYNSTLWDHLIDTETTFTNNCFDSLKTLSRP